MAPIDLYERLKAYYTKEPPRAAQTHLLLSLSYVSEIANLQAAFAEEKPPAISPRSAAALSVLFTLIYVVPFYVSKTTRPSPQLSRDAPSVIRARIRAVAFACVATSLIAIYVITRDGNASGAKTLQLLGWWPVSGIDIGRTLLLVAILFAGPLFETGIVEGSWRDWIRGTYVREVLSSWIGWRNYVAGPITEELIWRSLIIPLHLLAKVSPTKIVFVTPLYFGIAHVHHFYEFRLTHPHTPVLPALLRSVFQFTYTSLFGWFAAFVFLRTSNVYSVILAHSFCNWMGLPRFWGRVGVEAGVPIGPPDAGKRAGNSTDEAAVPKGSAANGSLGVGWTIAYYVILVSGAVGFWINLRPLTESAMTVAVV